MVYRQLRSAPTDPTFVEWSRDLLQTTSRHIIFLICGITIVWQILTGILWPGPLPIQLLPISLLIILAGIAALYLHRSIALAQIIFEAGLIAGIVLYLIVTQHLEFMFLLGVVPLLAVLTIGWMGGLGFGLVVAGLMVILVNGNFGITAPVSFGVVTVMIGLICGLVGWMSVSSLQKVTQWAVFSYKEAARETQLARERQGELMQVQQDLILANNELARLSDSLKVMNHVAEEARRIKEEFVANVSHELRTPLNMIIGFTETIIHSPQMYGAKLPPKLMADISAIHRNSQHLIGLINDVLDLSQIEAGRMALTRNWFSLSTIIAQAIEVVEALFNSKGLYLKRELPAEDLELYCDGTRVREVLLNLLSNAGRITERGGVCVKGWREGDQAVVAVSDTGPGIAPADKERLFQPFQQLGNLLSRQGGSGLGLSISKRFVEMHGGKLWLESELGQGTSFYFSLPLEASATSRSGARAPLRWVNEIAIKEIRGHHFNTPEPIVRSRYLLLEHGDSLKRIFSRYANDVELHCASDPDEAVEALRHAPCQALIINSASFEVDDVSTADLPFGTPVMTCWIPSQDEVSRQLGVYRYLVKPVTRDQVLHTLDSIAHENARVLVIDDITEELQLFVRILESSDRRYRVLRATSGQQALDLMRQRGPDVVLLDLIMPEMDGFGVLKEKGLDPSIRDIPVIVISSRDPTGSPIVANQLRVTRNGGLSVSEFLNCVQAIAGVLSPLSPPPDPATKEAPPA